MAMVKRDSIAQPADLKREIVTVDALGGDVAVLELTLEGRLACESVLYPATKAGEPAKPARGGVFALMPHLLAACVVDADDEPIFDAKQWKAFGARNRDTTIELFNTAFRLSGFDASENAKNS